MVDAIGVGGLPLERPLRSLSRSQPLVRGVFRSVSGRSAPVIAARNIPGIPPDRDLNREQNRESRLPWSAHEPPIEPTELGAAVPGSGRRDKSIRRRPAAENLRRLARGVDAVEQDRRMSAKENRDRIAVEAPSELPVVSAAAARVLASIVREARRSAVVVDLPNRRPDEPDAVAS